MFQILFLLFFLGLAIAYLITLGNAAQAVRPQNRAVEPSDVWLMLIPIYNYVWAFILYKRLARSLTAEYRSRGMSENADSTYPIGAIAAGCMVTSTALNLLATLSGSAGLLTSFISLTGFIFWIIYWIQINSHKNRIRRLPNENGDSLIFNN